MDTVKEVEKDMNEFEEVLKEFDVNWNQTGLSPFTGMTVKKWLSVKLSEAEKRGEEKVKNDFRHELLKKLGEL